MQGVFSGIGGKSFSYEEPNNELLTYLRHNVHAFSAAKSLTQMVEFNNLLTDENGNLRSKEDFTNKVAATGALFNKNYLATERNAAIANTQMAVQWDKLPEAYIEISTAGDDKVRPWHAVLDGFTAPKSDPVWQKLWPPFDWNCRCHAIPGVAKNAKDLNTDGLLQEARVPAYFRSNSGLTRTIFNKKHPYFKNGAGKEKELTAQTNYAMQSVAHLYEVNDFPAAAVADTPADANSWWADNAGTLHGYIDVKDGMGSTIRLTDALRRYAISNGTHKAIPNCKQVITNPDEVWSIRKGDSLTTTYLRYYEGAPIAIQVTGTTAHSIDILETANVRNTNNPALHRRGILIYRKN